MAWALLFDGVNDYVQTGTPLNLAVGDTFTVKAKANSGSNYSLVGVELNTTNMIELRPEGVKIRLNSSLSYILSGGGYIKPPIGVYFVVELERISSSLYECRLDGVVIGQIASSLGFIINIFGAIRKIYSFDGEIEYVKNGTVSYWDATASNHGAGTPILIDTVGGNNAIGLNMPTDGSSWLDLGGSGVTVSADIEISKPEFSVSGSVTFPQASSSIELLIASPIFSVNSSVTVPQPQADASLVIQKPVFSVSALVTLPNPDSDISTVIQSPVFNSLITVTTPDKVSNISIDIGKPGFSVNTNVTLPQPVSLIATNISKPLFSASISVTDPSFISNIDIDISGPVFSIKAVITQPLPVADINFNISKPIFSIMATVTGLDIIVGSNAKLTVNFESNKLTLKTQSNYLKV